MIGSVLAGLKRIDGFIDVLADRLDRKRVSFYPTLAGALVFLMFSIVVLLLIPSQISVRPGASVTARTFPKLLTYIMMICSALLLLKDAVSLLMKRPIPAVELSLLTEVKALIIMGLLIIYAVLMRVVGFIPSSVIYGILMTYYFRVKNWKYYAIVITAAIAIGYVFRHVLNVRLP